MKKITLSILVCLSIHLSNGQNDCSTAVVVSTGVTSVGTIDGTYDNTCGWETAGDFGEWFVFTATTDGVASISSDLAQNDGITNSDDTRLSVFTGSCGDLTCYAQGDDIPANFLTTISFAITSGTDYYLLWDDRWSDLPFDFEITETTVSCPDGTLPFDEDFSDPNTFISCWETIDDDGDGQGWFVADYDQDNDGNPDGNPMAGSASWNDVPLTPDNWLISGLIDLSSISSNDDIDLSWIVRGIDPDFSLENYTVYAASGNTIADFLASSIVFTETLSSNNPDMDDFGNFESRDLDISALAGGNAYVAFRHHDVSDQFVINIDNIAINVTLSTNDFDANAFSYSYESDTKTLNLESSSLALTHIEIFSLLGQSVVSKSLSNKIEAINVESLQDGIYLAQINIDNTIETVKFVKN